MKHKLTLVLLSFFLGVQCMVAQQMKVTGVVINEDDGEPVIGASIVVKGTTIGTITDLDGKFELETQKDAKLIISYHTWIFTLLINIIINFVSCFIDKTCDYNLLYAFSSYSLRHF